MSAFLAFLWAGCWHRWRIHMERSIFVNDSELPIATQYDLQCERCGDMKRRRL